MNFKKDDIVKLVVKGYARNGFKKGITVRVIYAFKNLVHIEHLDRKGNTQVVKLEELNGI